MVLILGSQRRPRRVHVCLVTDSCLTLRDTMDCSLPGSSVHGDSPGKNTGLGCHVLLPGIFPTQVSNPSLQHCRWILYRLSPQRSPREEIVFDKQKQYFKFTWMGYFPTKGDNKNLSPLDSPISAPPAFELSDPKKWDTVRPPQPFLPS